MNMDLRATVTNQAGRMLERAQTLVTTTLGSSSDGDDKEQKDLPKLPVPELEKTLQRYMEAVQPILSPAQFTQVQQIVQSFGENEGPQLQLMLLERQIKMKNWAYEWWLNDMYMNNPLCLPINSNPGGVWPPQAFSGRDDQLRFASKLIAFLLDFKDTLDRHELQVEKARAREPGQPLCMAQHYRLLTSYRVPSLPRDILRDTSQIPTNHIIVAHRNQFYKCGVKSFDEKRLSTEEIFTQLKRIVTKSEESGSNVDELPVGIMTSQKRQIWADDRIKLLGGEGNKKLIEDIETCGFLVCLDEPLPVQKFNVRQTSGLLGHKLSNGRDETNILHQMLHGGGSAYNTGNRWFDKTMQFIVGNDGAIGICYEHSPAEGIAVMNLIDEFLTKLHGEINCNSDEISNIHHVEDPQALENIPEPCKLEWDITAEIKSSIRQASMDIDQLIETADMMVYRFPGYGKEFIKKCKVSPDVYLQLSLQLAYYSLHGRMVATYESASTRRFKLGRVDSIRTNSMEALYWVESVVNPKPEDDNSEKLKKFHKAVEKHTNVMVENIMGEGIDIHLLGLKQQAIESDMELPPIFQDETFKIANNFLLSTSQLPTKHDQFMGYGAVVPDGYSASYNIQPDNIIFCLGSFKSSRYTSTMKFSEAIEKSLYTMKKMLSG